MIYQFAVVTYMSYAANSKNLATAKHKHMDAAIGALEDKHTDRGRRGSCSGVCIMRLGPAYVKGRGSCESALTCRRSSGSKLAIGARAGAELLPAIRCSSRSKATSISMRPARVRASGTCSRFDH